ncbi:MAG: hypothetical protein Q8K92_12255 [Leadbetterella sp.]|nr:hypothetical protein [Leadbetterella sp.]
MSTEEDIFKEIEFYRSESDEFVVKRILADYPKTSFYQMKCMTNLDSDKLLQVIIEMRRKNVKNGSEALEVMLSRLSNEYIRGGEKRDGPYAKKLDKNNGDEIDSLI